MPERSDYCSCPEQPVGGPPPPAWSDWLAAVMREGHESDGPAHASGGAPGPLSRPCPVPRRGPAPVKAVAGRGWCFPALLVLLRGRLVPRVSAPVQVAVPRAGQWPRQQSGAPLPLPTAHHAAPACPEPDPPGTSSAGREREAERDTAFSYVRGHQESWP